MGCFKQTTCRWPEIHAYCGICNRRTGIYIRTVIWLILNIILIVANIRVLIYMAHVSFFSNIEDDLNYSPYLEDMVTDYALEKIHRSQLILKLFRISYILMKVFTVIIILVMIYGVYKKRPSFLKVYLHCSISLWIIDLIISSLGIIMDGLLMKIFLVACLLSEGYHLLAVNTEYKVLSGKSKLVLENTNDNIATYPNGFVSPPHREITFQNRYNDQPHCRTCTCNLMPIMQVPDDVNITTNGTINFPTYNEHSTTNSSARDNSTPEEEQKDLNFKEIPIIFDQSQLNRTRSVVVEIDSELSAKDSIESANLECVKDIEVSVIYDLDQLNLGSSPVVEDRQT